MPDHIITLKQERGFVRLTVEPSPSGGIGLPTTYFSAVLALSVAERLHRERGWIIGGGSHGH